MKEFFKKNYLVILVFIFVVYIFNENNKDKKEIVSMYNAMQDSTITKFDKLGRKYYETSQIRSSDPEVFLSTKSNDSSIKALQNEVKTLKNKLEEGGSVTLFNSNINIKTPLQVAYQDDGSIVANASDNTWYDFKTTISGNKGVTDVNIISKPTISLVKEKDGFKALVRDENPYIKVDSIRSFVKVPNAFDSKYSIGVGVSYDIIQKSLIPTISVHRILYKF